MMTLWESIESLQGEDWKWGEFDCVTFCARVVLDTTGVDYRDQFPAYSCRKEALGHMRTAGGLPALITGVLGPEKSLLQARKGDVVTGDFGHGCAAGICVGQSAAFASRDGVIFAPMSAVDKAWSTR